MNYLAHAYLSFDQPQVLIGNMAADFIKGKKQFSYSLLIQKGIQLHRAIDAFTDEHPVTKQLKIHFQSTYRLYSGAFADIVYDHFLATDKSIFKNDQQLLAFTQQVYATLHKNFIQLPEAFQHMLPYMTQQNWLYNYQHRAGIQKSFGGLVHRAAYLKESDIAFALFNENYGEMQKCYKQFFSQLHTFAALKFKELLNI
jgi:acyl carrier protein phosphodiesterase